MAVREENFALLQRPADGTDLRCKNKKSHPCDGCYYFGGKAKAVQCCNYYLITGIRRPCDAGFGCTVRRDEARRRKAMAVKVI